MKNLNFRYLILIVTLLIFSGLQGCGKNQAEEDAQITDNVNTALSSEPSLAPPSLAVITVETKDGVVTLIGTVENDDQADTAKKIAESIDGVKRVESNLQVQANSNTATTPAVTMPTSPTPAVPTAPTPTTPTTPMPSTSAPGATAPSTNPGAMPSSTSPNTAPNMTPNTMSPNSTSPNATPNTTSPNSTSPNTMAPTNQNNQNQGSQPTQTQDQVQ